MINDIIYFHVDQGGPPGRFDYFKYVLEINRSANPGARHHLMGDYRSPHLDVITPLADLRNPAADDLAASYRHLSPNPYEFELNCLLRWFYLREYLRKESITRCVYLDSDNVLLKAVSDLPTDVNLVHVREDKLPGITFVCPNVFVLNEVALLCDFVDIVLGYYKAGVDKLEKASAALRAAFGSGISDMFFWGEVYHRRRSVFRSTGPIADELFCLAIENPQGYETVAVGGDVLKKLLLTDGGFFVRRESDGAEIPVSSLHFHGVYKRHVVDFHERYMTRNSRLHRGIYRLRNSLRNLLGH